MKAKDFFERIYVVNLPNRTDRRKRIVAELEKVGLPLTQNRVEIFPAIRPDNAGDFPNIGARGCFLSHLAILKQAKNDGLSNVLIMEDDLVISNLFREHEEFLVKELQQTDWGIVYLGHPHPFKNQSEVTLQRFTGMLKTTHFYAVNGVVISQLIEFLEEVLQRPPGHPDGGPMHVDGAYDHFRAKNPNLITLLASPSLGSQESSRSDITPSWLDQTLILKDVASTARTVRMWLKNRQRMAG